MSPDGSRRSYVRRSERRCGGSCVCDGRSGQSMAEYAVAVVFAVLVSLSVWGLARAVRASGEESTALVSSCYP